MSEKYDEIARLKATMADIISENLDLKKDWRTLKE